MSLNSQCVLGLDGGGTKVEAVIAALDGTVLGRGRAGACSLSVVAVSDAVGAVMEATNRALEEAGLTIGDVQSVCAGVAGYSVVERRLQFIEALQSHFSNAAISVEPDYTIALTGATGGAPGLIVIAGTGSVAYGENAQGRSHKSGAYGMLIDDSGSGYGVGRSAIAAVLHASDGTGEVTSLTNRILETLHLSSVTELVPGVYDGRIDRVTIASLSRCVSDAARDDNDTVANAILMRAGGALAILAKGVTDALFADAIEPFIVAPIGSLWESGEALTSVFHRSLLRFAPHATFVAPIESPVIGAVRRALRALG